MLGIIVIHGQVVYFLVAHIFDMLWIAGHAVEVQPPHVAAQTHKAHYDVGGFEALNLHA